MKIHHLHRNPIPERIMSKINATVLSTKPIWASDVTHSLKSWFPAWHFFNNFLSYSPICRKFAPILSSCWYWFLLFLIFFFFKCWKSHTIPTNSKFVHVSCFNITSAFIVTWEGELPNQMSTVQVDASQTCQIFKIAWPIEYSQEEIKTFFLNFPIPYTHTLW